MQKLTALRRPHYQTPFLLAEEQTQRLLRTIEPDTCISLIKQCGTLRALKSVHASMLTSHLHLNLFFFTNLISRYASFGSISHAYCLFSSASHSSDIFLWNVMLGGFVGNGHYHRSILLYRQMLQLGIQPDNFTFPIVLKACGCLRDINTGIQIHRHLLEFGYESDVFVANSLIAMYGKCQRFDISRQVFDRMPKKNVVSWSSMIGACGQNGLYEEGLLLFSTMLGARTRPNRVTILNVMACVRRQTQADNVCRVVIDNGLDFEQSVQNAAMLMYARCGRIDVAWRFFDGIFNKDLVSWASMIEAYAQADLPLEALQLFKHMRLQRILADSVTLLSVIHACSVLASFQQARLIHGIIIRSFFKNELAVDTALVDLFVKCGSLVYARKVFDRMHERNIISWSTMISGYGIHSHGKEALYIFNQMKASIKPDHITFVSILSACSHGGLISEGWECFNSMVREFGLTPRPEHYACMVDLLGRAGQLNEACDFIKRMPMKPDASVWGALLGACQIHLHVELAEMAARSLFELDAENPGRYILLSNIYALSGKRKEANRIRVLMKQRGVRKIAGHTIIEVKNNVTAAAAMAKATRDLVLTPT